ncbi:hypothetical protein DQ244_00940 [Blastococcus sp. TBT05-19]|uniref:hypothetical protein n=1 Tax=Blastococcus sp. TBT05-19 TaxID=2250581 RepID=UPI000DEA4BEA|nr:hypothetical protein [Blastococcus sp. TBT05-19]RBY93970.1 hypothetical protein DQ244_00940 [Blastococcus sp. TBT05-19]
MRLALPAGVVTGLLVAAMAAAVAVAGPALAIDDPSRPDAQVTRGPSCQPGGIVVELVAGTAAYTVRLSTTRQPAGEDEVTLVPQGTGLLQTGDVAPGETIDPRLEFTARDGSGVTYVDELEDWTLTRPTTEDCEAVRNPAPTPPSTPTATVEPTSPSATPSDGGSTGTSSRPSAPSSSSRPTTPGPTPDAPTRTSDAAGAPTAGGPPAVSSSAAPGNAVIPGGTVTLSGAGFLPGERVDILLRGTETVIATATAGPDGAVRVDVRIPDAAEAGPATLDLVGADSAVSTGVDLQVAAADQPVGGAGGALALASLVAAAVALVGTVGALVSVIGRQHAERRGRDSPHSA